jgi:hypothetical protein
MIGDGAGTAPTGSAGSIAASSSSEHGEHDHGYGSKNKLTVRAYWFKR